jgi:hypothetical protein
MSPVEQQRLRDGMAFARQHATTHSWRFYFSYLLGRPVTLAETDQFLREEAEVAQLQETR